MSESVTFENLDWTRLDCSYAMAREVVGEREIGG